MPLARGRRTLSKNREPGDLPQPRMEPSWIKKAFFETLRSNGAFFFLSLSMA